MSAVSSMEADATMDPESGDVASLRGPKVDKPRLFWRVAATLGLILLAAGIAVSAISSALDNARQSRLRTSGIAVNVTVNHCQGNLGGSGSNPVNYTCTGTYHVASSTYHETIGALSTFAAPGSTVKGVADPAKPSTVVLASSLTGSGGSPTVFIVDGVLLVALGYLTWRYARAARRWRTP